VRPRGGGRARLRGGAASAVGRSRFLGPPGLGRGGGGRGRGGRCRVIGKGRREKNGARRGPPHFTPAARRSGNHHRRCRCGGFQRSRPRLPRPDPAAAPSDDRPRARPPLQTPARAHHGDRGAPGHLWCAPQRRAGPGGARRGPRPRRGGPGPGARPPRGRPAPRRPAAPDPGWQWGATPAALRAPHAPPPRPAPAVSKPGSFGGFFPDPAAANDLAAKLEKLAAAKPAASSEGDALYAPLTPTFSVPLTTAGSATPLSPLSTPTTPVAAIVLVGGAAGKQQHAAAAPAPAAAPAAAARPFAPAAAPAGPVDAATPLDDAEGFAAGFEMGYDSDAEDGCRLRRDPGYGNPLEADGFAAAFAAGALKAAAAAPRAARPSWAFVPVAGNPLDDAEAFAAGFEMGYDSDSDEAACALRRDPGYRNPLEANGFAPGFASGAANAPPRPRRASWAFRPVAGNPLDDADAFAAGFDLGYSSE
jgi:hypothetical protein